MLSRPADALARQVARLRLGRVRGLSGMVKINLGSGLHVAPGWINVDGSVHALVSQAPLPVLKMVYRLSNSVQLELTEAEYLRLLRSNRFVFAQLERPLPFDGHIADFVYSSHVLEHFYIDDALRLLKEIYRILKPGGRVRICVPDLEYVVSLYQQGHPRESLGYLFTESRTGYYRQHRYMYNFEILRDTLAACGFTDIREYAYQKGETPDITTLDNRPAETLYVEAAVYRTIH